MKKVTSKKNVKILHGQIWRRKYLRNGKRSWPHVVIVKRWRHPFMNPPYNSMVTVCSYDIKNEKEVGSNTRCNKIDFHDNFEYVRMRASKPKVTRKNKKRILKKRK